MKILVTGATGFVGSHVCRHLAQMGHSVLAFHRPGSRVEVLHGYDVILVQGDIGDLASIRGALKNCDAVIHCAAEIRYRSVGIEALMRVNAKGSAAVAQACREVKVRRLVHVSSTAAIGLPPKGSVGDEKFAFNAGPQFAYHVSKHEAENAVLTEVRRGLDAVIVNPGSIFGPFQGSFRGGDMMSKVRGKLVVPYFTGGICAVHVLDVVEGIARALDSGAVGERYILGGENVTYRDIVTRTADLLGARPLLVPLPASVTAVVSLVHEMASCMTGRPPQMSQATHRLASMMQFFSSNKAQSELAYQPRSFRAVLDEWAVFAGVRQAHSAGLEARVER